MCRRTESYYSGFNSLVNWPDGIAFSWNSGSCFDFFKKSFIFIISMWLFTFGCSRPMRSIISNNLLQPFLIKALIIHALFTNEVIRQQNLSHISGSCIESKQSNWESNGSDRFTYSNYRLDIHSVCWISLLIIIIIIILIIIIVL